MLNRAALPRIPREARPKVLPGSVPAGIVTLSRHGVVAALR